MRSLLETLRTLDRAVKERKLDELSAYAGRIMSKIVDISGREILDSRGNPTVEADVIARLRCAAAAPPCPRAHRPARAKPSSCATATARRYLGKGVRKAVANVNGDLRRGAARARIGADQEGSIAALIDARRQRQQVAPRRQRAARGLARGGACGGGRGQDAALSLAQLGGAVSTMLGCRCR